jgi:hypothetical protein
MAIFWIFFLAFNLLKDRSLKSPLRAMNMTNNLLLPLHFAKRSGVLFRMKPLSAAILIGLMLASTPVLAADDAQVEALQRQVEALRQALEQSQKALADERARNSGGGGVVATSKKAVALKQPAGSNRQGMLRAMLLNSTQ